MECRKPIEIKLKGNQKIRVACGKCMLCRKSKATEWTMRLMAELGYAKSSYFITLTYDDEHLPHNMNLEPKDLTKFWKRVRKANLIEQGTKLKYYACGEYGDANIRPHYHAIVLNMKLDMNEMYTERDVDGKINLRSREIDRLWPMGKNAIGAAERQSIFYVTGYIRKKLNGERAKEEYGENIPPFSRSSGNIGYNYVKDNAKQILELGYIPFDNGVKRNIPRTWLKWLEKMGYEKEITKMKFRTGAENTKSKIEALADVALYMNEDKEEIMRYIKVQERVSGEPWNKILEKWLEVKTSANRELREKELKSKDLTRRL